MSGQSEPMNWGVHHGTVCEEVVHRFRAKAVCLLTGSCPTVAMAIIGQKVPCAVVCPLADFCHLKNKNQILKNHAWHDRHGMISMHMNRLDRNSSWWLTRGSIVIIVLALRHLLKLAI